MRSEVSHGGESAKIPSLVFLGRNVFSVPLEGLGPKHNGTNQGRQMRLDDRLAREHDKGLCCFGHDVPQACTLALAMHLL